jgi:threonine dehydrogenase-like Zn-dependent dehydrogenase
VLAGQKIGEDVSVGVGRTHYGLTRWVGTTGANAADSYKNIPATGEIRDGDNAIVIGAGGPMGQMHVIRLVCSGFKDISIIGTDFDDERLESLRQKAEPMSKENDVKFSLVNPQNNPVEGKFSYFAIMAPIGALVAQAVKDSTDGALINVFAGIPATVKQDLDLDTYITNKCFMFGTSGSRLIDMKIVLEKVLADRLNTDCSVDAVSGMAGAIDGIRAVENRAIAGKIIVYPELSDMPLIPLSQLAEKKPAVAEKLSNGIWTKEAEDQLLGK